MLVCPGAYLQPKMIDAFLRSIIGSWGNWLLDQYIANSLWINGLVLGYALLVGLARRNFQATQQFFLTYLEQKYTAQFKSKNQQQMTRFIKHVALPWQQALKHTMFPFLSPPNSLWIYPKTEARLRQMFSAEFLAKSMNHKR